MPSVGVFPSEQVSSSFGTDQIENWKIVEEEGKEMVGEGDDALIGWPLIGLIRAL